MPCRFTNKLRLRRVHASQEFFKFIRFDEDVIVSSQKPFELVYVVLVHVMQHHEGFFLRRVAIVNPVECNHGQICASEMNL